MMPKIPKTDSIQELATFWQRHDVTDFEDELEELPAPVFQRTHVVEVPLTGDELVSGRLRGRGDRVPYTASVLRVMIASPGDVPQERRIARDIVNEWNTVHSQDRSTVLLPIAWETHASPALGDRAQEIINKQLLRSADVLVAIFWTRLGTPTDKASSGTVEEIEEHLAAEKPAMLYFSTAPVQLASVDAEQYKALSEFKNSIRERGLVQDYESIAEFREKFTRQLAQTIVQNFPPTDSGSTPAAGSASKSPLSHPLPDISKEGRRLLKQAALDPNGVVIMVATMGGLSVETNGQNFVERGDPRSEARWRDVIRELAQKRLLEQRDQRGEVYAVTDSGFRVADVAD